MKKLTVILSTLALGTTLFTASSLVNAQGPGQGGGAAQGYPQAGQGAQGGGVEPGRGGGAEPGKGGGKAILPGKDTAPSAGAKVLPKTSAVK